MIKTAVVILHFGDKKETYNCLKSVGKIKGENIKIFVVDNGTNAIKEKELKKSSKKAVLIKSKINLGFAGGMNLGIRRAVRENFNYVLLLNNDLVVSQDLIKELLKSFKNSSAGIVGPIITYNNDLNKIWFAGGSLNKIFCFTRHPKMNEKIDVSIKSGYVDFITGACVMIKKEVFKSIGLFDDEYFLYWEDVDFCFRAQKAGFNSYLSNKPLAAHNVSASAGIKGQNKLTPLRAYCYSKNAFLFMEKNKLNLISGTIGQFLIRLPYFICTVQNGKSFKEYIRGLSDGFRYLFNSKKSG